MAGGEACLIASANGPSAGSIFTAAYVMQVFAVLGRVANSRSSEFIKALLGSDSTLSAISTSEALIEFHQKGRNLIKELESTPLPFDPADLGITMSTTATGKSTGHPVPTLKCPIFIAVFLIYYQLPQQGQAVGWRRSFCTRIKAGEAGRRIRVRPPPPTNFRGKQCTM